MTFHRYRWQALRLELLQAVAGLLIVIVPLFHSFALPFLFVFFSIVTALFIGYGVRTVLRLFVKITVTADVIEQKGLGQKRIEWAELTEFSLSFFGSRQARPKGVTPKGYMHLKLRSAGVTIKADSSIDDFPVLVEAGLEAALRNKLEIDPVTAANLEAMDLATREILETADGLPPPRENME